ncbi:MAG: hypothetical protein K0S11_1875, partial [Gammaproteobacteria bacterium]|nr:hypothetical protein [Gammaproteobacteria bacterium]
QLAGQLPLASLARINNLQEQQEGVVNLELNFFLDEQRLACIQGQISTEVWLTCQRCLEPYQQSISAKFILSPVTNDREAAMLPAPYEPLLVENTMVELAAIVEDEILLSIPIVAKHAPENCAIAVSYNIADREQVITSEKVNPFKVLANLKTNKSEPSK